ncbi:hypothetical protein ACJX0J_010680, partial [Zea mays]
MGDIDNMITLISTKWKGFYAGMIWFLKKKLSRKTAQISPEFDFFPIFIDFLKLKILNEFSDNITTLCIKTTQLKTGDCGKDFCNKFIYQISTYFYLEPFILCLVPCAAAAPGQEQAPQGGGRYCIFFEIERMIQNKQEKSMLHHNSQMVCVQRTGHVIYAGAEYDESVLEAR